MTHSPSPHSPIRILHLVSSLEGGAGRGALEIVRSLQNDDRYEARLCVLGDPPADRTLFKADPVEYLHAPVQQRSLFVRRWTRLRRLLSQWPPRVLHTHLWPSVLTAGLVAPRSLPHLVHIRDTPPSLMSPRWAAMFRRCLLRRIASNPQVRFVSVSSSAGDYTARALSLDRQRIQTVLNGIELDRFLAVPSLVPHPERRFVIGCAGRLIADKGFDLVLIAISQVSVPRNQVLLRIAGAGSGEPALRELSRTLGITECVEFVGQVANMPEFFAGIDLFVHASVAAEGLSRALIEAQAAGRPVVTSDHAGAREAIDDGVTGNIVPARDPAAIARSIDALIHEPVRWLAMGTAARERAARTFSAQRVVAELTHIYTEMLNFPRP